MNIVFTLAIIAAAAMVVVALVRGLVVFTRTHEGNRSDEELHAMQNRQTELMFSRVKWQFLVVLAVVLISLFAAGGR